MSALAGLSDIEYQNTVWFSPDELDSFDLLIDTLYDDDVVLPAALVIAG